jgi:hypothetical protein
MFLFQRNAGAPRHSRPGRQRFNAAAHAAAADIRAAKVDRNVSSFAGNSVFSMIDLLVDDDARADARADGHVENVIVLDAPPISTSTPASSTMVRALTASRASVGIGCGTAMRCVVRSATIHRRLSKPMEKKR